MTLGKLGDIVVDEFSVLDSSNNLISNIPISEFNAHLFDPNNNEIDSTTVMFIELGHGHYRASFIPNQVGNWMLIAYHSIYFPWGKSSSLEIRNNDVDTLSVTLSNILNLVEKNIYIDQTQHDVNNNLTNSRVRIYDDENNVGTPTGVIDEYTMIAIYDGLKLLTYEMKRV